MRPLSIRRFEWAYATRILVAIISAALVAVHDRPTFGEPTSNHDQEYQIGIVIALLVWETILLYTVSREAKKWARSWILSLFVLQGMAMPILILANWHGSMLPGTIFLPVANFAFGALAVWLLFRPDADRWFNGHSEPYDLQKTFQ